MILWWKIGFPEQIKERVFQLYSDPVQVYRSWWRQDLSSYFSILLVPLFFLPFKPVSQAYCNHSWIHCFKCRTTLNTKILKDVFDPWFFRYMCFPKSSKWSFSKTEQLEILGYSFPFNYERCCLPLQKMFSFPLREWDIDFWHQKMFSAFCLLTATYALLLTTSQWFNFIDLL